MTAYVQSLRLSTLHLLFVGGTDGKIRLGVL